MAIRAANEVIAKLGLIALMAFGGGVVGYLSQTEFVPLLLSIYYNEPVLQKEALEPVSKEEYARKTRRGWWIGFIVGGLAGVSTVITHSAIGHPGPP